MNQEWKLVPVEPTTEQRLAVCMHPDLASALYRSMIKAAPVPPAGGDPEVLAWRAHGFNFSTEAMAHDYNKWAEEKQPVQYLVDRAHVTRLQAENAALQQRLNVADQWVDDLQHQQSQSLEVNPHSLRVVLTALVGAPHEIRELQACRGLPDNPIDQLRREYNAWIEKPTPATPQ